MKLDFSDYTLSQRLLTLILFVVIGVVTARFAVFPVKYGARLNWSGYKAATRTWRWFGWQPGPVLRAAIVLLTTGLGMYLAFPELFGAQV